MTEDTPQAEQKRLAGIMLFAMWILLFLLLAMLFNNILEKQHNPNQTLNSSSDINGAQELVLQRNRYGHYVTSGSINQQAVTFMLDTGATDVSIPESIARELGLKKGPQRIYQTANGQITVYLTELDQVSLGNIKLHNVRATINPNVSDTDILLGMSFLKHIEFSQRGDTLTLRQYPTGL